MGSEMCIRDSFRIQCHLHEAVVDKTKSSEFKKDTNGVLSCRPHQPLYAGQLNSKYKGKFLGSCSVTVIHRVTAIYRAVMYMFDCNRELHCDKTLRTFENT